MMISMIKMVESHTVIVVLALVLAPVSSLVRAIGTELD